MSLRRAPALREVGIFILAYLVYFGVRAVTEGTGAKTGVLDPVGASLAPGSDLYPQLLGNLIAGLTACLARS